MKSFRDYSRHTEVSIVAIRGNGGMEMDGDVIERK
jgi:hypothetical protein